jgi:hypothetical protein
MTHATQAYDDVEVSRPSRDEWEAFKDEALAELGLTYQELEQQARDRAFTSPEARRLWVVIGDERPAA